MIGLSAKAQQIHGYVTEHGTNQPVAGAMVRIRATIDSEPYADNIATSATGEFLAETGKLGRFVVNVEKQGYQRPGPIMRGVAPVVLDEAHQTREVNLVLARAGSVTGRVVDEDSGKPIPQLRLAVWESYYSNGRRVTLFGVPSAVSDPTGTFVVRNIFAGDHVVEVAPEPMKDRILRQFTPEETAKTDLGYRRTFWPGGHGPETALPFSVGSGMTVSAGTLVLRKQPLYRLHIAFAKGSCKPGDLIILSIRDDAVLLSETLGNFPCEKDIVIKGFSPGNYRLSASVVNQSFSDLARASTTVAVTDRNLDVALALSRGTDISGLLLVPDGVAKVAVDHVRIAMSSDRSRESGDVTAIPDENGGFTLINKEFGPQTVVVSGLPSTHYVREIRYSGGTVLNSGLTLNPNAATQSLEIVLDDKPGSIAGNVTDGGTRVAAPIVGLVPLLFSTTEVPYVVMTTASDDTGQFLFTRLPPGEYRVFAIPVEARFRIDEPLALDGFLSRAKTVTLTRGAFQTVNPELQKP